MKKIQRLLLVAFSLLLSISACEDDYEGLMVQDHDQNEFMSIMHDVHAKMDAMHVTGDADTILQA